MINGVIKPGLCTLLHPFYFSLSPALSILSIAPCPSSFSLSLCSTVFILLQRPHFCGAVSVVDTMKTGRIHYLALHFSHPRWFALPTFPFSSLLLSTRNAFFHHTLFFLFFFHSLINLFLLFQLFLPWLVFTLFLVCMHMSPSD